jgi:hypothetical protein
VRSDVRDRIHTQDPFGRSECILAAAQYISVSKWCIYGTLCEVSPFQSYVGSCLIMEKEWKVMKQQHEVEALLCMVRPEVRYILTLLGLDPTGLEKQVSARR